MFYEFHTGLLTYLNKVHFWLTKEVYWRNWPKHSSRSQIQMPRKRLDSWDKWKNFFHLSFKAFFVLLIYSSSLSKFVFLLTNNTCTLLALKKKVIQSTSATEGITSSLLNRKKKELITTACEQLSSTEGAPTVTRSLVSLRSSFDLELT